jgi:hypothetical protein
MGLKLTDLNLPMQCVVSLTLLALSAGYGVALLNLYFTYSTVDGKAGLTPEDLIRSLSSPRGRTLLAAKIDGGSMEQFLRDPLHKARILNWIQDGAGREQFEADVAPILKQNCVGCHNPSGLMYLQPLDSYEAVQPITQVDRGEPVPIWARVAHTHLQAIGLVFFVVGGIFAGTSLGDRTKTVVVVLPFVSLLADFGARFLARYHSGFVYLMMAAGAVGGLAFAAMVAVSLFEIWWRPRAAVQG